MPYSRFAVRLMEPAPEEREVALIPSAEQGFPSAERPTWDGVRRAVDIWLAAIRRDIARGGQELEATGDAEVAGRIRAGVTARAAQCHMMEEALGEVEQFDAHV